MPSPRLPSRSSSSSSAPSSESEAETAVDAADHDPRRRCGPQTPTSSSESENEEKDKDDFEQVKVINHIKSGAVDDDLICLSNSPVAVMEATSRDKVINTQGDLVIRSTANGDNGLGSPHQSPPTSPSPENTQPSPSSSPEPSEPSAEELRSIRLRNNNVRQLIYKEVKKPGRGHAELWDMLASLHGPPIVRRQFIQEVRQEAVR